MKKEDPGGQRRSSLRNGLLRAMGVRAHFTRTSKGGEVDGCGLLSLQNICDGSGANHADGTGEQEQDASCSGHFIVRVGCGKVENIRICVGFGLEDRVRFGCLKTMALMSRWTVQNQLFISFELFVLVFTAD